METKKDYLEFEKGVEYSTAYQSLFGISENKSEVEELYGKSEEELLNTYNKYYNQAILKLNSLLKEVNISAQTIKQNPYSDEEMLLKEIVPTLGMLENVDVTKKLKELGLDKTVLNIVHTPAVLRELKLLTELKGLSKDVYGPIIMLISLMVQLKIRMTMEQDYGQESKDGDGTIINTRSRINKAHRQLKENKVKTVFDNNIEAYIYSKEGESAIKASKLLFGKNKGGSYNMRLFILTIFELLISKSELKNDSKNQQYKLLYPLFREIYPERKMNKNEEAYAKSDDKEYTSFEKYQVGNMKSILGTTRPSKGLKSLMQEFN